MLVTNHVLAGAVLGAVTGNPAIAYGLGVASHFAMDALPHWGPEGDHDYFMRVAVRDGLCGLAALAALAALTPAARRRAVLAGALGAATPDLDKPVKEFTGLTLWPAAVNTFHVRIQRESASRLPVEFATALVGSLTLALLNRKRAR